jgi:hypothetical protein
MQSISSWLACLGNHARLIHTEEKMIPDLELNNLAADTDPFEDEIGITDETEKVGIRPYDPNLIRVEPKMFSLRNIMDMIDEGDLDLAPDFQRLRVWKSGQKSRLIESLLLRIPLPAFYFASDSEGKLQVVDGVQRLSTIYEFVRGKHPFRLTNLEYLDSEVGGKTFEELKNTIWAKRIYNTQIVTNVIDPQTPMRVKFDIFKRINTGGTPLNGQEIRHCMSGPKSRDLLLKLAASREFEAVTNGTLTKHVRMADREMVLRVLAMHLKGIDGYLDSDSMDDFLNLVAQEIDEGHYDECIGDIESRFLNAMKTAHQIFGEHAFRKWPIAAERKSPLNKAVFEALGGVLCSADAQILIIHKNEIIEKYRELCTNDGFFIRSISQSTADPVHVSERFTAFKKLLGHQ